MVTGRLVDRFVRGLMVLWYGGWPVFFAGTGLLPYVLLQRYTAVVGWSMVGGWVVGALRRLLRPAALAFLPGWHVGPTGIVQRTTSN